jgi:hypothetical protein
MSADDMFSFPLPLDRNGKVIRFGDIVDADRYRFEVTSFQYHRDGAVQVCGGVWSSKPAFVYDAKECVLVEEPPFSERFRPGDIVTAARFGRLGGERVRVIGWVPERNIYVCVRLEAMYSVDIIRRDDNPTLLQRAS